jgi:uncharacterized membrane protein
MNDLRERISEQARQSHMRKEAAWSDAANRQSEALNEMNNSPVEDAALGAVRQFFAWETFLGLKIISAIGALLLLLGVFTFGRYLYLNIMGPELQCAAIFALGLLLVGTGEFFHQKKWRGGFTLALTASGSGILFLGAALGHMTLDVLPMWSALAICAGVSLLTFAAALRYNAQLVAIFALVGGYLPLIALEAPIVLFGAIYFTILSLLALLIATRKNWRIARFIGLGAGLISQVAMMDFGFRGAANTVAEVAIGASIAIGFVTYLVIPVFGAWFTKTRIKAADVVLLSSNLFFSFLTMRYWGILFSSQAYYYSAYIAAFFAVCCIIMALITERQKHSGIPESETGSLRALFFITSVTFSALVVLFALDNVWFSVGWLIQAAGLALYGIYKKRRRFNIAGLVIGAICLLSFLLFNLPDYNNPLFKWQYLSITLAAAVISIAAMGRKPESRNIRVCLDTFRSAAIFNLWGYMVYALFHSVRLTDWWFTNSFAATVSIAFGFALAFVLPRIKRIYSCGFQITSIILGSINVIWLLIFNATFYHLPNNAALNIAVYVLYVIVNIIGVFWVNDILRFIAGVRKLPLAWYPLLVSGFAVILVTQNLVVQLDLIASSLILTLVFGLTALGWVIYGFAKRNGVTRIGGLSMAFFAIVKLFVLDLHGLDTTWRIISYFTGGVVLLTISFAYQWFSKRLGLSGKKEE